jgi:ribosomal protein L40E
LDTTEKSSSVLLVKKRRKKLTGNAAIVANQSMIANQTALAMDKKDHEIQQLNEENTELKHKLTLLQSENNNLSAQHDQDQLYSHQMLHELLKLRQEASDTTKAQLQVGNAQKLAYSLGLQGGKALLIDADVNAGIVRGKGLDIDALLNFNEKAYIDSILSDDSSIVDHFIKGVLMGSKPAKMEYFSSESSLANQPIQSFDKEDERARIHAEYLILSELLGYCRNDWISPLMTMFQFVLLTMTKCPTLADLFSKCFSGTVTPRTVWNWIKKCVQHMKVFVDPGDELFLEIDNWGYYRRKQSRSSISKPSTHPIVCNGLLFGMKEPGKNHYQYMAKYSPLNEGEVTGDTTNLEYVGPTYKRRCDLPDDFASTECLNRISDSQILENMISLHAKNVAHVVFQIVDVNRKSGNMSYHAPGERSNAFIGKNDESINFKICEICQYANAPRATKCRDCAGILENIEYYRNLLVSEPSNMFVPKNN